MLIVHEQGPKINCTPESTQKWFEKSAFVKGDVVRLKVDTETKGGLKFYAGEIGVIITGNDHGSHFGFETEDGRPIYGVHHSKFERVVYND